MRKILLAALVFASLISVNAHATTYYVRTDGGPPTRCTGTTDAADTGSGTSQPCAFASPYVVLPHPGNATTWIAHSGDTVVIDGSAEGGTGLYRIGCQGTSDCMSSPNINFTTSSNGCSAGAPQNCTLGIPNDNVTIIGCSLAGCGCTSNGNQGHVTTCTNPRPSLWGAGGGGSGAFENVVLLLKYTTGVHVSDLDITDHSNCGGLQSCVGGISDLSANNGIDQQGASGLVLTNIDVHGMKSHGIVGGLLGAGGVAYHNLRVYANPIAGIDFSNNCVSPSTCGVAQGTPMIFDRVSVKYSGCTEEYPLTHTLGAAASIVPGTCFEQNTGGGYGDGVGNSSTSGNWTVTDSEFSDNTSDGFDLLYADGDAYTGANVIFKRNIMENNVGACFKDHGTTDFEDNICIASTQYWFGNPIATTNNSSGGNFNGGGFGLGRGNTAIQLGYNSGTSISTPITLVNNTVISNMDQVIDIEGATSTPIWTIENNILEGGWSFTGGQQTAILFYNTEFGGGSPVFHEDHNVCGTIMRSSTLPIPCAGTGDVNEAVGTTFSGTVPLGTSTSFNTTGYYFSTGLVSQLLIKNGSGALNLGVTTAFNSDPLDFYGSTRTAISGAGWDDGAIEQGSTGGSAVCGNGIIESGETCDGAALAGATCISQGFTGGSLSCATNCGSYVTTSCTNTVNFPLTSVLDTFTRANSTGLGANWTNIAGSWNIVSNAAIPQVAGNNNAYFWNPTSFTSDEEVYATVSQASTNGDQLKLAARYNGADQYYKLVVFPGGPTLDTYVFKAGIGNGSDGPNDNQIGTINQAVSSGDSVGMSLIGNQISIYYKAGAGAWVKKATYTDSTVAAGGSLYMQGSGGAGTPNLQVTNFGGGSLNPIVCGNNIREGTELCDGTDLNNQTCTTKGFTGGTLSCAANCLSFVTSSCTTASVCGNNTKETGETCDGTDLASETCALLGFTGGTLSCNVNCLSFNTSACVSAQVSAPGGTIVR